MTDFRERPAPSTPGKAKHSVTKTPALGGGNRRRGERLNSRVPVAVEWSSSGERRRGEARTRVIGPYGCLVVLRHSLEVQQQVHVTNLVNKLSNPARIVWRGHEGAEGWELGIELLDPEMGFWGLEL
jgi:hypothetical protein